MGVKAVRCVCRGFAKATAFVVLNDRDDLYGPGDRDDLYGRDDPPTNRDRRGYAGVRAPSRSAIRERQQV